MYPERTALGAIALAAMIAVDPQAIAEERPPPQASTNEERAAKPPEGGTSKPGAAEEVAPKMRLVSILGREVTNREGDSGRVIDVLVNLDGHSGCVVVEFGGFLGIGSRKIAVDWSALRFVREGNRSLLTVDVSREQIRDTPEYKPNEPPKVLGAK